VKDENSKELDSSYSSNFLIVFLILNHLPALIYPFSYSRNGISNSHIEHILSIVHDQLTLTKDLRFLFLLQWIFLLLFFRTLVVYMGFLETYKEEFLTKCPKSFPKLYIKLYQYDLLINTLKHKYYIFIY